MDNILIPITFILFQFGIFIINFYYFSKKLFHPSILFSLLWTIIVLMQFLVSKFVLTELYPISFETYLFVSLATLAFSLGAAYINHQLKNVIEQHSIKEKSAHQIGVFYRLFFTAIVLVGLPFYLKSIFNIYKGSNLDNIFIGIRSELIYGELDIGPTKYLVSFSIVTFAINYFVFLQTRTMQNRLILLLSFTIAMVYTVFYTGRTSLFMILAIYLGINNFMNNKNFIKKVVLMMLFFTILFSIVGIIYEKGGSAENGLSNNISSSFEYTSLYLVSPLNAMDFKHNQGEISDYSGNNTLGFFVKLAENIHLLPKSKAKDIADEYVFIPYPTNVYTIFRAYIQDFGKGYALFIMMILGALQSFLYLKAANTKSLRYVLYYSFLLFPLMLSFFRDHYFTVFSSWLKIVIYVEVFLFLNKHLPNPLGVKSTSILDSKKIA